MLCYARWGPWSFGLTHGEGTDMQVTADGSALLVTGHCSDCTGMDAVADGLMGRLSKVS